MIDKHNYWKNQTLVNRVDSDTAIAGEYYLLAKFVITNYPDRMETIQMPLLHIISHCIELSVKAIIIYAIDAGYVDLQKTKVIHSHDIAYLTGLVLQIIETLCNDSNFPSEDLEYFSTTFPALLNSFSDTLQVKTASYRYSYDIDRAGTVVSKGVPFGEDKDSPNICDISPIFYECYDALTYTHYILENIFPKPTPSDYL